MDAIRSFRGDYRFLSNFYQCPFEYEGLTYPNSEAAFQAAKAVDPAERVKYTQIKNPVRAKQMGKREVLRPDWNNIAYGVMDTVLHAKFSDPTLVAMLLATGDAYLEEGNHWHDNRWGRCSCDKCRDKEGQNWLGKILMGIRDELRARP